jgi:hypothetical protein
LQVGHVACLPFSAPASSRLRPRSERDALSDGVQPGPHRFFLSDGARPAREDQKSCLKSVFGLVEIAQEPSANTEDHGTMPPHQKRKRLLVPLVDEAVQ